MKVIRVTVEDTSPSLKQTIRLDWQWDSELILKEEPEIIKQMLHNLCNRLDAKIDQIEHSMKRP
jgi:hypothetical protein